MRYNRENIKVIEILYKRLFSADKDDVGHFLAVLFIEGIW